MKSVFSPTGNITYFEYSPETLNFVAIQKEGNQGSNPCPAVNCVTLTKQLNSKSHFLL